MTSVANNNNNSMNSPRGASPSPSFGSSPIRDSHGGIGGGESPNTSFSTDLRTFIGDDDITNFLDSTSVHQRRYKNQEMQHLGDTIAVIQNEMQAQIDALSVKVTQWRSNDQKDMYRDRELLLSGMKNSNNKIKHLVIKQSEIESKLQDLMQKKETERGTKKNIVDSENFIDTIEKHNDLDSDLVSQVKHSLSKFDAQESSINELRNKINTIGEKQQVMNLDINKVQDALENAVASLQSQINTILSTQQTIVKEIRDRDQNERLVKQEIKRLEMLFSELSRSNQNTHDTSNIFMDEMIAWRKEIDSNNNIINQNINRISNDCSYLRNEVNRDKLHDDRSFKKMHVSINICEEEIRKLKKQLILAVKLFRKRKDFAGVSGDDSINGDTVI